MHSRLLTICFASLVWLINPAFVMGCGGMSEAEFTFGEAELLALTESVNEQTWDVTNAEGTFELMFTLYKGEQVHMTQLGQVGVLEAARACGNREFVTPASACMNVTYLGIEGSVTIVDALTSNPVGSPIALRGAMEVMGLNLSNAMISLSHGDGEFRLNTSDDLTFSLTEAIW